MREYIEKLCIVLLFVFICINAKSYTEVTVENGGYKVLVSFSQNVPPKDGVLLLEDMKESLTEASKILHSAIGLGFSKVVFKIPISWNNTSELNATIRESPNLSNTKSNFLISNTNNVVFGKMPYAQQYGICGIPGSQITVPTAFFEEANTFPKGLYLAREWLKYRYGVFDENGYLGDPLYPLYYTIPGSDPNEVKITDCTNEEVTYNFLDQKGNNCLSDDKTLIDRLNSRECSIKPEENENITSSMMYFEEDIHTLEHICGKDSDHNHNSKAPNKQNALCNGRSIWDVVKESPDIEQKRNEEYRDIEYVYEQESAPKVVVAWENTLQLKNKGPIILSAIKNFVIDLPNGSKFNGFPFKSSVPETTSYTLFGLNGPDDKNKLVNLISSDFVEKEEKADINIAISTALKIFSDAEEAEGTIIIIGKNITKADEEVLEKLKKTNLCLMFILFSKDEGDIPTDEMAEITRYTSASSCAVVKELLPTVKDEDTFGQLLEAIEVLLPSAADKAKETAKIAYLENGMRISFHVDDSIETVTFTVFSKKEGASFDLYFNQLKLGNVMKQESFADVTTLTFSPTQAGDIEFEYPHDTPPMLTHVTTTSKKEKFFSGEIFIHDTSEEESIQMPVIIYAVIRYGNYPVQNAKVEAIIERPNAEAITLKMNDDGKGNPDITKNDGVYSRYFIMFTENGTYTVTVTVTNTGDLTTFGDDKDAGYLSCCGSNVNSGTSRLTKFTRELKATFKAKSGRPDDGYKPLRISDLRIDKVIDDKITLTWTAPGEEADNGTATQYEIKIFCGEENVTICDTHEMVRVLKKSPPLSYGRVQQVIIQVKTYDEILSVGIITVNKKNKQSDLSNTVEIFRPTNKPLEVTTENPQPYTKHATSVGTIVAIVVPCILIIIGISGAIINYFTRKSHRKKPEIYEIEENINKDNQEIKSTFKATDCSIKSAPVKKIESFPVLLYTHDQIKDFKDKDKNPRLYKTDVPSKMWKSLDVISNLRNEDDGRDTKSLGSSNSQATTNDSEVHATESQNK